MNTVTAVPVEVKVETDDKAIIMANVNNALLKFDTRWAYVSYHERKENDPEHRVEFRTVKDITDKEVNLESLEQLGTKVDTKRLKWAFLRGIAQYKKDEEAKKLEMLKRSYAEDKMHGVHYELAASLPNGTLTKTSEENYLKQNWGNRINLEYVEMYTDSDGKEHKFSFVIEKDTVGRYRYSQQEVFKIYDNSSYGTMQGRPKKVSTIADKIKKAVSSKKNKIESDIKLRKANEEKLTKVKNIVGDTVEEYEHWVRGGRRGNGYVTKQLKSVVSHKIKGREYPQETSVHFNTYDGKTFSISSISASLNADQMKKILDIVHEKWENEE